MMPLEADTLANRKRLDPVCRPAASRGRTIGATALIGASAVAFALLAASGIDWVAWTQALPAELHILFWPAMVLLPLIGFPISAFTISAAFLFPLWMACLLGLCSLALNMALGYWIGCSLWQDFTKRQIQRRFPGFAGLSEKQAFRTTVLVRAIPGVPYFLQNYILAVLGVPFGFYLTCSLLIQGSFLIIITLTINGGLTQNPVQALTGGLLFALLILVLRQGTPWKRIASGNGV